MSFSRSTPGTETVTVGSSTATVNWAPSDTQGTGHVNFLPEGNTATYQGAAGVGNYTVLNRIVPTDATRAIELNGSVLSKLDGGATGGDVWFYSPGGIVVGAKATFDVGGLLLSTVDLPNGFSTSSSGFSANFSKNQPGAGAIQVLPGAAINARSSYVAIIAPRIEQGGNIQVNGSAAYAAAEAVDMTFNQGLFSIAGAGRRRHIGYQRDCPYRHDRRTGQCGRNGQPHDLHDRRSQEPGADDAPRRVDRFRPGSRRSNGCKRPDRAHVRFWLQRLGSCQGTQGTGNIDVGSSGATSFTSDVFSYADGSINIGATTANISFSGRASLWDDPSKGVGKIQFAADNQHTLSVAADMTLVGGDQVTVSADHGGVVNVTGTLLVNGGTSVRLFDDFRPREIQADTLSVDTAALTNQASPAINNFQGIFTGDFSFSNLSVPGSILLTASGNLTVDNFTAGNSVALYSSGDLAAGNVTVTGANGTASFSTPGLANFTGTVSAPDILVISGDINIASGAAVGVKGVTQSLDLTAVTHTAVYIGGGLNPPSGAYVFNEQGKVYAQSVTIASVSASDSNSTPDIYIGDAKIDGSLTTGELGPCLSTALAARSVFRRRPVQQCRRGGFHYSLCGQGDRSEHRHRQSADQQPVGESCPAI